MSLSEPAEGPAEPPQDRPGPRLPALLRRRKPATGQLADPLDDIAEEGHAFTEHEDELLWLHQNCRRCLAEADCHILTAAMLDMTPHAWVPATKGGQDYQCKEFRLNKTVI